MLYLNALLILSNTSDFDLTLTNVVFELNIYCFFLPNAVNLTLTNVVFEFEIDIRIFFK